MTTQDREVFTFHSLTMRVELFAVLERSFHTDGLVASESVSRKRPIAVLAHIQRHLLSGRVR